jgi:hypothetical protein
VRVSVRLCAAVEVFKVAAAWRGGSPADSATCLLAPPPLPLVLSHHAGTLRTCPPLCLCWRRSTATRPAAWRRHRMSSTTCTLRSSRWVGGARVYRWHPAGTRERWVALVLQGEGAAGLQRSAHPLGPLAPHPAASTCLLAVIAAGEGPHLP